MIKPFWAILGAVGIGTAGAVAVYIAASGGGEEEITQQVDTPAASETPIHAPAPTLTASTPPLSGIVVDLLPVPAGETPSPAISVGSLQKWSSGKFPAYSPDGSSFLAYTDAGLVVGSNDGGALVPLEPNAVHAIWAPDSQTLAVAIAPQQFIQTEAERLPIYLMAVDGSSRHQIAETDRARRIQFLTSNRLAYMLAGELHIIDTGSGVDSIVQGPSLDPSPTNDLPFLFSPDGDFVAVLNGTTLTVVNVASGSGIEVSSNVDFRGAAPFRWSDDGELLFYTYQSAANLPEIAAYGPRDSANVVLVTGVERGTYGGVSLAPNGGWLVFAFYPTGSEGEINASYEAVNVYTGLQARLFRGGLGLGFYASAQRVVFTRSVGAADQLGTWVAAISY